MKARGIDQGVSGRLAAFVAAVGLLAPLPGGGADKAGDNNRTQGFVVGMSDDLGHKAGIITNLLRKVMRQTRGIHVLDLTKRLKAPAPEKMRRFIDEARESLKAAKAAMREMEHAGAIEHASKARAAFEKMGGFLEPLDRYKESILIIAVGHSMQGEIKRAKAAFLDLLLLDPHTKLPKTAYEGFVIELYGQVKQSLAGQPLGSLSIKTSPAGGNLYVDGKLRGVTPMGLDGLVAGNHLVIVKLPGYENWGKVLRVQPGEHEVLDLKLSPGRAGRGFIHTARRACRSISDEDLRGEVLRLGQNIGLDWAVLGQLKHDAYDVNLHLYLFEFSRAQVVYEDQLQLDSSEYGMEEDVHRFGVDFMRRGIVALKDLRERGDPLSGHSGTDGWYRDESKKDREHRDTRAEDEGGKANREKESGDPLDEKDGTEDW